MASAYGLLAQEISRIVRSPYPTQLKTLHNIVLASSDADVSDWVLSHPCQVNVLAQALRDGIEDWPYVVDIIACLSKEVSIRDALLDADSSLLHLVVSKAIEGDNGNDQYIRATVSMLSTPLPENTALPAAAQTLFLRLFDHAAENPSIATVRTLYTLLNGACSALIGLLSSTTLTRIEKHLFNILRGSRGPEPLSLYCLAVMKLMCQSNNGTTGSIQGSQTSFLLQSDTHTPTLGAIKQFFTGPKAQRTLELIVLSMIMNCKMSERDSSAAVDENAILATEILAGVTQDIRLAWCADNSPMVCKLEEKALSSTATTRGRLRVLCFLGLLKGEPSDLVNAAYAKLLIQSCSTGLIPSVTNIDCYASTISESAWSALLEQTLECLQPARPVELLRSRSSLAGLVLQLTGLADGTTDLRRGVFSTMGKVRFLRTLQGISLSPPTTHTVEHSAGSCDHGCVGVLSQAKLVLATSLCTLYITCALVDGANGQEGSIGIRLAYRQLYEHLIQHPGKCIDAGGSKPRVFEQDEFVEVQRTPQNISSNWREQLSNDMQLASKAEQVSNPIFATAEARSPTDIS